MEYRTSSTQRFASRIIPASGKIEFFLAGLFVVALILKLMAGPRFAIILNLMGSVILLYYYLAGFVSPLTDPDSKSHRFRGLSLFLHRVLLWSCSLLCLGIVFLINHYPGGEWMLKLSGLTLIVTLFILILGSRRLPPEMAPTPRKVALPLLYLILAILTWIGPGHIS